MLKYFSCIKYFFQEGSKIFCGFKGLDMRILNENRLQWVFYLKLKSKTSHASWNTPFYDQSQRRHGWILGTGLVWTEMHIWNIISTFWWILQDHIARTTAVLCGSYAAFPRLKAAWEQKSLHETLLGYPEDVHKDFHRRAAKLLFNELGFSFGNNREFSSTAHRGWLDSGVLHLTHGSDTTLALCHRCRKLLSSPITAGYDKE